MEFHRSIAVSIIGWLFSATVIAEDITGTFSSFMLSSQSGDIVGMQIHIVPTPKGYSAIVQGSEGAPGYPEVFEVDHQNTNITFATPESTATGVRSGPYKGNISEIGLSLQGPTRNYELTRKPSYWQ